jgi:hypothetical protein
MGRPPGKKLPNSNNPFAIRVPQPLLNRIRAAAERLGIPDAEVIRLATGIGLERLRRIDYDIDSAVNDAAEDVVEDANSFFPVPPSQPVPAGVVLSRKGPPTGSTAKHPGRKTKPGKRSDG